MTGKRGRSPFPILLAVACIAAQASAAAAAAEWRGADLGSATGGSHAWNGTTLTVTGGGEGLDVKPKDDKGRIKQASPAADRCRFVFVERAAGEEEPRYVTTPRFLEVFRLERLEDLPKPTEPPT